jgi:hypothetical protein
VLRDKKVVGVFVRFRAPLQRGAIYALNGKATYPTTTMNHFPAVKNLKISRLVLKLLPRLVEWTLKLPKGCL